MRSPSRRPLWLAVLLGAPLSGACSTASDGPPSPAPSADGGAAPSPAEDAFDVTSAYPAATTREGGDQGGVQLYGRWDLSDPSAPSASWGAVYFEVGFTGTGLTLTLESGPVDYAYRIDAGELLRLSPSASVQELELARGLAPGQHRLSFYRLSGGSFGATTLRQITPHDGALFALPRWTRQIEFLGDSISVGYGNEGTGGTSRATENGYLAYGPQTARLLDASWSVIAHSGQGMVRNLGESKDALSEGTHMPDEFLLTHFPGAASGQAWAFDSQPDAFVIMLGTNDFAWPVWNQDPGADYELTEAEYVSGYASFLRDLRGRYPTTEVFALGTLAATASNQFGRANQAICAAVAELDDPHMRCVDPSAVSGDAWLPSGGDYIGDWTHPNVTGSEKLAARLAPMIADALGWQAP